MLRALCLVLLLTCGMAGAAELKVGDAPPVMLGKDRHGDPVDLATLRGKVVVIAFWASWCGYCLKELPVLDTLQKHAGERLLQVVAVNVKDDMEDYRLMTRQMRNYSINLTRDPDGTVAAAYGVRTYPNIWIIDPEGKVAEHHDGYSEDALEAIIGQINRVLREQAARLNAAAVPAAG